MMPVDATIEIDKRQADAVMAAIRRNSRETGRGLKSSLAWGGRKIMQSLGARTPIGKATRKVIENPDKRWKTDNRRARFGVMAYSQTKQPNPRFVPIRGTGEYGKIRFKSKTTGEILTRDATTGQVSRLSVELGKGPNQIPGVMQSPKRKIGRRKFGKKSWRLLSQRIGRGGAVIIDGIPRMGDVTWTGGTADPTVTINNRVTYLHKILQGGASAIGNAMEAAAQGMMHQMDNNIRKTMGAK
jgi:hypothetical protein